LHFKRIYVAAGYGGEGGSVSILTCGAAEQIRVVNTREVGNLGIIVYIDLLLVGFYSTLACYFTVIG